MTAPPVGIVLGNILDNLQIQLPEGIVNWLTPVWILSLGFLVGLLGCLALWGLANLLCRIPVLGTLHENPVAWRIAVAVIAVLLLAVTAPSLLSWSAPPAAQEAAGDAAPAGNSLVDQGVMLVAIAAACLLAAMGIVTLLSRKTALEIPLAVREGVLQYFFIAAVVMASFSVLGLFVVRRPSELLSVLYRYPQLIGRSEVKQNFTLPPPQTDFGEPPQETIAVRFRKDELRKITFQSDQLLKIRTEPFDKAALMARVFTVAPQQDADAPVPADAFWERTPNGIVPFVEDETRELYVRNYGTKPAQLTVLMSLGLAHPEMLLVPYVALFVVGVFVLYLLQRAAMPKLASVALSTAKSDIAQPVYVILLVLTAVALVLFLFIPYYTLGEDIRMLKNASLELLLVIAIIQAVWAASSSVSEEIEGRTALTVLSKPVSRRDFILGKFVGIAWSVGWMLLVLGLVLLVTVAYKPLYDAREGAGETPVWQTCFREMVEIVPGITLAYFETLVMAALSVAISTRLPVLANFIITFSIYTLGHLTPLLVQSQTVAENVPAPVIFLAQMLATVLPVLDHFNIQANIAAGRYVPADYVGWSLLYCVLYSAVAMLVALTLFEDRDLA
jgi:ABC-type transport system involved in multi-copper enzyme maturation permease subunit